MIKNANEKYVAKWNQSKWLVLSSFFFTIPAYYAHYNALYFYSILLLLTSFVSANYWRKATLSWRRNADLVLAKISFTIFVANGVFYVRRTSYVIIGYTGLFVLLYCYHLSGKLLKMKNDNWYKYHFLFHFIMMYEQVIIIDSILEK